MTRDELDPLEEQPQPKIDPQFPAELDFDEQAEASRKPDDVYPDASEPISGEQTGPESKSSAPAALEPESAAEQPSPHPYANFDNQAAVDRFFEAYRQQRAAAGESAEDDLLPADAPLRRKDGYFYAERRRLPPPTPFEELVFSYSKPRTAEPAPEVEERWLPPTFLPQGSPSTGGSVAPPQGEIKVIVEVRLTGEARERITEQAIAKAAQTHQNHTEIVAKRLYELTREIRDREAARRVLYRR